MIFLTFPCLLVNSPVKSDWHSSIANWGLETAKLLQRLLSISIPNEAGLMLVCKRGLTSCSHLLLSLGWPAKPFSAQVTFSCPNQTSPAEKPQLVVCNRATTIKIMAGVGGERRNPASLEENSSTPITQPPASPCVGTGKSSLLIFSPLNCVLAFFSSFSSESYWSKEPEQGNIPMQGPLTTAWICMAEHISKHFAVVRMWRVVLTQERSAGRDLLQKEKFKSCFCFAPLLFLLLHGSCQVGAALQPLSYTICSFSAFKCGCKWFFQGHAVTQGQSKEITENSCYVFHDLARNKSPHCLGKGKRGAKFLFIPREKESCCTTRWANEE